MPIVSNSIQNNGGGTSPGVHSQRRTYRSGNSTLTLREGQTLKGVVSDIHGNEITLSMDDGTSFTGKLPDANQYSIGQKAAFQIVSLGDNTIYMKATTGAYLLDMEDTVEQALEEAGLPKSSRNLEVVRSLLQNGQSISSSNIVDSIRLCAHFPDADVHSVITMKRLNLPMTESSVKQFENYQNETHALLNKMDSLTDSINDMLTTISTQVPRLAKTVAGELLSLSLESPITPGEQKIIQQVLSEEPLLAEQETTQETEQQIQQETSPTAEEQLTGPFAKMRNLLSSLTENTDIFSRNGTTADRTTNDLTPPFIREQLGHLLPTEERLTFSKQLDAFPFPEEIQQRISDGTITTRQFLQSLQEILPQLSEKDATSLFSSKNFHLLLKEQFLSNWTIEPEQLKEENALQKMYTRMSRQFTSLSHFSENVLGKDIFSQLSQNAGDMTDNLTFIKTLNETFQYVQLPLKLQEENAHGDLYVMTKKEALKKNPNNLKVLLHLCMDSLGTLDIHITKENTTVTTQFFVDSQKTSQLLQRNIEILADAIQLQGYSFHSDFSLRGKEADLISDFTKSEVPVGDIKRYNFDLRA